MMGNQPWDQNFWPGMLPEYRPCPAECATRDRSWSAPCHASRQAFCEMRSDSRACGSPGNIPWQSLFRRPRAIPLPAWVVKEKPGPLLLDPIVARPVDFARMSLKDRLKPRKPKTIQG